MTREETKKVLMAIQGTYANWHIPDKSVAIDLWTTLFDKIPYSVVMTALQTFIVSDKKGFAPAPGQLMEIIRKLTVAEDMNGNEAWALVSKALRNSTYNSVAEFEKLPEEVKKAVGSASMLHQWATDENFNESVVSSNFLKSYKVMCDRKRESALLPDSARTLLKAHSDNLKLEGE